MTTYHNLETMLRDIRGYARSTGTRIVPDDDPDLGWLGWATPDGSVRWRIHLNIIAFGKYATGSLDREFVAGSVIDADGRRRLLDDINRDRSGTIADPARIERLEESWRRGHAT